MAVGYDTVIFDWTGANSSKAFNITIANVADRALIQFVFFLDAGAITVQSVTGAGATWSLVGGAAGNDDTRGEVWVGINPTVGAQTTTVTLTGPPSTLSGHVYSFNGVHQTTPTSDFTSTISGNVVIDVDAGDMAVCAHYETFDNRTVSGCTSTLDTTSFTGVAQSAARCTGTPTSTFTWSGFGLQSLALGCAVNQVAVAAGHPAGRRVARSTPGLAPWAVRRM